MSQQPNSARKRDRTRMNVVTSAVGVSGVAGALALALNLPGSTHNASSSSSTTNSTTENQSTSESTTQGTTSTGQAPQSTTQSPQATSGGS